MKSLLFFLILCFSVVGFAEFSESRTHSHFRYQGPILPDEYSNNTEGFELGLYIGKGTWEAGKEHLKMFFKEHNFSYRSFTAKEIAQGDLSRSGVRLIIIPGGESWEYLKELSIEGASQITDFVNQGGGYFGVCAGAFYATSHREGGYATGPYGIGLLNGIAYDGTALKTEPFKEGMLDFELSSHFLLKGLQSMFRMVLLGGPSFRYTPEEAIKKQLAVLATFQKINEPAMVVFNYGKGKVFLSGPHLEIEEDRTDWGPEFRDPDSEWPMMERIIHYIIRPE
ncbi:MAG: hypothetical protein HY537_16440 [Deltaproteobacteria bacterium]|nr:hypothetical protein [Deltaproteobacteria bacterium]